jgi:hypothetical protein
MKFVQSSSNVLGPSFEFIKLLIEMLRPFVISDILKQAYLAYLGTEFLNNLKTRIGRRDGLDCPGFESRQREEIPLLSETSRPALGPAPTFYAVGNGVPFSGMKRLGHEVQCSPPCSTDLKNKWRNTSTPKITTQLI